MATTPEWGLTNDFDPGDPLPAAWANLAADALEAVRWGYVAVAMADANQSIADAADKNPLVKLTGALTAARTLTLRTTAGGGTWWIWNATTGGFGVTVKTAGGTGPTVPAGYRALVACDGTDVILFALLAVAPTAYTVTNGTTDRTYDANATTLDELADIVSTLISDLRAAKIIG